MGDLGKIIVVTSFEWLPKVQKIAHSCHTESLWTLNQQHASPQHTVLQPIKEVTRWIVPNKVVVPVWNANVIYAINLSIIQK